MVALDPYPGLWLGAPGEPGSPGGAVAKLEALAGRILELREMDPAAGMPWTPRPPPHRHLRPPRRSARSPGAPAGRGLYRAPLPRTSPSSWRWGTCPRTSWTPPFPAPRRAPRAAAAVSIGARAAGLDRWRAALRPLAGAGQAGGRACAPPRLVTGAGVQELLGIPPGPEVGEALAALRQAQVDGRVPDEGGGDRVAAGLSSRRVLSRYLKSGALPMSRRPAGVSVQAPWAAPPRRRIEERPGESRFEFDSSARLGDARRASSMRRPQMSKAALAAILTHSYGIFIGVCLSHSLLSALFEESFVGLGAL